MKRLDPDMADCATTEEPLLVEGSPSASTLPEIIVLDDVASPVSSTRSVSLEATGFATSPGSSGRGISLEATDDGYASDERDELADDDFLVCYFLHYYLISLTYTLR